MSDPIRAWTFQQRWRIQGLLSTKTPLRIGSGSTTTHPDLVSPAGKVEVNAHSMDHNGCACIFGSTLKGCIRSWLEKRCGDNSDYQEKLHALFGRGPENSNSNDMALGGSAEFHDAVLTIRRTEPTPLPYWRPDRQTWIEAGASIDRVTRTAVPDHLVHSECVPAGVGFSVTITGCFAEEDMRWLLAVLEGFNETENPILLGADTAGGKGGMTWSLESVHTMNQNDVLNWVRRADRKMAEDQMRRLNDVETEKKNLAPLNPPAAGEEKDLLILPITLVFDSHFLVNDPPNAREVEEGKEKDATQKPPSHRPRLDAMGCALLPAHSFRGALRSQAERILRTLGLPACRPTDHKGPDSCGQRLAQGKKIEDLCLACQIFGAPGWRSPLEISDFHLREDAYEQMLQEFVAIDRFTGGAKDTAKFNALSLYRPVLTGELRVREKMIPKAGLALLALTLRDLKEGDITFGFGAAKGYGACTWQSQGTCWEEAGFQQKIRGALDLLRKEVREKRGPAASQGSRPTAAAITTTGKEKKSISGSPASSTAAAKTGKGASRAAEEGKFHNPYHFIPVNHEADREHWIDRQKLDHPETLGHQSHAQYAADAVTGQKIYHGRIVCTLTTQTPTFIGAGRSEGTEDAPAVAYPFTLASTPDNRPLPAIPASSLRGLISSVAEAASNSALRVLDDRTLSYRIWPLSTGLSAIGMISATTDESGATTYRLRPLALPTLKKEPAGNGYVVPEEFRKMFVEDCIKLQLEEGVKPRLKVLLNEQALAKNLADGDPVFTYSSTRKNYYRMNLTNDLKFENRDVPKAPGKIRCPQAGTPPLVVLQADQDQGPGKHDQAPGKIRCPRASKNRNYCIGQIPNDEQFVSEKNATAEQKKNWTRGIIRVLAFPKGHGQKRDLPDSRKHELFIPYPEEAENWPTYPIQPAAIALFNKLADERTAADQTLPFEPYGTLRNTDDEDRKNKALRLKDGDLVFFRPSESGDEVAEIAFSSLWRRGPVREHRLQTLYDFFSPYRQETADTPLEADRDMLPMHPKRTRISPAEMVFGFVEQRDPDTDSPQSALAYAGRVRFSHALFKPTNDEQRRTPFMAPVTLKILDTPKPPSPALYFTQRHPKTTRRYIDKRFLNPSDHKPQGRKMYLHHRKEEIKQTCWATYYNEKYFNDNPDRLSEKDLQEARLTKGRFKQKVTITPIPEERTFRFHVDFDNLSAYELGMLLYALQPHETFWHKIGMGKPLGLGSIHIQPVALFLLDRHERYAAQDIFTSARWSDKHPSDLEEIRAVFEKTILPEIKSALEMLGNPENTRAPVHYPQISTVNNVPLSKREEELEQYRWWVANDLGSHSKKKVPVRPGAKKKEPKFDYEAQKEFLHPLAEKNEIPQLTRHKFAK